LTPVSTFLNQTKDTILEFYNETSLGEHHQLMDDLLGKINSVLSDNVSNNEDDNEKTNEKKQKTEEELRGIKFEQLSFKYFINKKF
jgi:hypothetical protein